MAEIAFRFAWGRNDPSLARDAREFWHGLGALEPNQIDERAKELCALAYAGGKVVAASTVNLFDYPRLRSRFFYYRTTVDPGFRRQRLAGRLCGYSRDRLAEWAREHPEEKLKGLFIIPEAEEFRSRLSPPIIKRRDLGLEIVIVGYTSGGYQMRVVWFADATVE